MNNKNTMFLWLIVISTTKRRYSKWPARSPGTSIVNVWTLSQRPKTSRFCVTWSICYAEIAWPFMVMEPIQRPLDVALTRVYFCYCPRLLPSSYRELSHSLHVYRSNRLEVLIRQINLCDPRLRLKGRRKFTKTAIIKHDKISLSDL